MFMPKDFSLNPEFRANLPRTGHNLSHDFGFTATVGHLLPVIHDIVNPGETVSMSFNYDIRTMPLQQAAMTKLKVHTEYFFVPMQLLYEPFGSLFFGINDQFSSVFSASQIKLPLINWADFYTYAQAHYNEATEFSEAYGKSWIRLLDMFGLNPVMSSTQDANGYQPNIFPWQILAYNCIYQYYYRIDERQRFDQTTFNVDRFYNSDYVDATSLFQYCGMKYRPFDDDYFTSIHVSPIVGNRNLNSVSGALDVVNSFLTRSTVNGSAVLSSGSIGGASSPFSSDNVKPNETSQTQFGFKANGSDSPIVNGVDISTANIRAMFANEKLWSITGRARKHYDDQTLAHFGYNVPHDVKHEITCFGHDVTEIGIGEVISTASTDGAPLGEIAGKGYGTSNNAPHKFTAPCHGVVMCIMSVTPKRSYFNTYLKVNALTNMNDLYKPELDHLGQQPLFGYELRQTSNDEASQIYGWQYRYEQYKRRYNRVTRAFEDGAGLSSWMTAYNPYLRWRNVPTSQYSTDTGLEFAYLPNMINGIMLPQYSLACTEDEFTTPALIYVNDPFVVDSHVTYNKVSSMSDYSLPRLDA